jgi:hypothetical protein
MNEQTLELENVVIEAETDLALLCNIDDKKHLIMRWFAEKEGLV